jgi:hypothetical protein
MQLLFAQMNGIVALGAQPIHDALVHAERRIILTFDLDFGEILALSGASVVSVILFRLNNTRTPFVQERLAAVLTAEEAALQAGAIVIVEDGRYTDWPYIGIFRGFRPRFAARTCGCLSVLDLDKIYSPTPPLEDMPSSSSSRRDPFPSEILHA